MPRRARVKQSESTYHIICRGISEVQLFRDEGDKEKYLCLLKRYVDKYKCRIYCYCLMDTHLHLHFDPAGFDISKFMQCVNVAYVRYYNLKYKRHGPVFTDRFDSKIVDTEEYGLTLSAYIHNNPKAIEGYAGREEQYPYSSYGIYLGRRKDTLGLVDKGYIMGMFRTKDRKEFIKRYRELVACHREMGRVDWDRLNIHRAAENEYRSGRKTMLRGQLPSRVMSFISEKLMHPGTGGLFLKSKRRVMDVRSFCVYAMRVLCGLSYREICENMFNITVSGCSKLCTKGFELITQNVQYARLFEQLAALRA